MPVAEPQSPASRPEREGLTLQAALWRWGNPGAVSELQQLVRQGFPNPLAGFLNLVTGRLETDPRTDRARELQSLLQTDLLSKLRNGELLAIGYDLRQSIDAKPIEITPDRWRVLKPDFEKSEATTAGLIVTGISVFQAVPERAKTLNDVPRPVARATLKLWYIGWVKENQEKGLEPSREQDWAAARHKLGDGVRRKAMRELREEHAPADWRRQGRRKTGKLAGQ